MKIVREIAKGGFGVVHHVELSDGRSVARKSFEPRIASRGLIQYAKALAIILLLGSGAFLAGLALASL